MPASGGDRLGRAWRTSLFVALGLLALALVVPPARLYSERIETAVARELGYPVSVGEARLRLRPWPSVDLLRAAAYPPGPAGLPLAIKADRVTVGGIGALLSGGGLFGRSVRLSGVEAHCGPLRVWDADFRVQPVDGALRIDGRALGVGGGSLEVMGLLGIEKDADDPLRVYLADFELPLSQLLGIPSVLGASGVRLSGVVTLGGALERDQRIEIDVAVAARRSQGEADWLQTAVSGRWVRRAGSLLPGPPVRMVGTVRDLQGGHSVRALHGPISAWLSLVGDPRAGRLELDVDMDELRIRLADVLEKRNDEPASVHVELEWGPGRWTSLTGALVMGALRTTFERRQTVDGVGWLIHSDPIPIVELRAQVPLLSAIPEAVEGELRADLEWSSTRGLEGEVVLLGVRVPLASGAIEIPRLVLELSADGLDFRTSELRVADQSLAIEGTLEWIPSPGILRVALSAEAHSLDLEILAELAASLFAAEGIAGKPSDSGRRRPTDWDEIAVRVVRRVRRDAEFLSRLRIDPAVLEVGELRGFGLDAADVVFRVELADLRLRLERGGRATPGWGRRYALDLQAWVPKLTEQP